MNKFTFYREGRAAAREGLSLYAGNPYAPPPNYTNANWSESERFRSRWWMLGHESVGDDDPTPWCHVCGAMSEKNCNCGPYARNH